MKKYFPIALFIFILSCNNLPKTKEETAEFLDGNWYLEDYISEIQKTKSVFEADRIIEDIMGVTFDKSNLLSGEPMFYGYNQHEGGLDGFIKWDEKEKKFCKDNDVSSDYPLVFEDNFTINLLTENKIEFDFFENHKKYRLIRSNYGEIINDILFTGNYVDDHGNEYYFKTNGETNFDGFGTYEVSTDFSEAEFDMIILMGEFDAMYYHYIIMNDKIEIYNVEIGVDDIYYSITGLYKVLTKK